MTNLLGLYMILKQKFKAPETEVGIRPLSHWKLISSTFHVTGNKLSKANIDDAYIWTMQSTLRLMFVNTGRLTN